jgi:hypothetical protein
MQVNTNARSSGRNNSTRMRIDAGAAIRGKNQQVRRGACREARMITLEDCIGLCGLTEEEVLAVAEHEHMPEIAATALAQYLLSHEHGSEKVRDMIVDDIRKAERGGDRLHVLTLLHVLHHFLKTHPEAKPLQHPWSGRP